MAAKEEKPTSEGAIDKAPHVRERAAREAALGLTREPEQDTEQLSLALRLTEAELKKTTEELNRVKSELKKLSAHDPLTDLPNRIQLDIDLEREIARSKRYNRQLALLYLDLDHFKKINDSYGHDFGDLLLKEVAQRLKNLLRTEDFLARFGGDEFAIILTEIDNPHAAGMVAHRIIEKMAEPFKINDRIIVINASIGIACHPDAGMDGVSLQKSADIALHCVKNAGRSHHQFFTSDLQEQHNHQRALESDLQTALEKNEFFLMYQPRIDIQSGKMICMEALLRWHHKERGTIMPADFLALAEETGLIIPIGAWVLKTACRQFAEWRVKDKNLQCLLTINVLPRQLQHKDFVATVKQILDDTALPPTLLELEITERAITGYPAGKIEDTLFQLRHLGVQFSIDDANSNYASLTRLKELPIQSIKISHAFVNDIDVVAKGMETAAQLQSLMNGQCPDAQGYFYGKPLTAEQMSNLITQKVEPSAS